jgi:deoxycytidylate deaminase
VLFQNLNRYLAAHPKSDLDGRDLDMLQRAHTLAARSDLRWKVGAVIYDSRIIFGQAYNVSKTHPFYHRWHKLTTHLHAEAGALIKALRHEAFYDHNYVRIAVARLDRTGMRAISYPCEHCFAMLQSVKINIFVCYDKHGIPVRLDTSSNT